MVTDSEAADIIHFLEQRGLLCLVCGEEAEWCTTWEHGKEQPACSNHLQKHRTYNDRKTTNVLYRRLLSSIRNWSRKGVPQNGWGRTGGEPRRGDPPLDPGGAPASELHSSNLDEKLDAIGKEMARAKRLGGGGVKASRDPLGADALGYLK